VRNHIIALSLAAVAASASGCASSGATASPTATAGSRGNRELITTPEIEAANAADAYELVQRLRPSWITHGTVAGGGLVVYVDDAKMGWLQALHDIPASQIGSIQYMDPATATAILPGLGSDFITGAIVVHRRTGK